MAETYRIWRCSSESLCYVEGTLSCEFLCHFARVEKQWTLYVNEECVDSGVKRQLTAEELSRIIPRFKERLEHRFLGFLLGAYKVRLARAGLATLGGQERVA